MNEACAGQDEAADSPADLDARVRAVVRSRRAEAFDNVDVERLLEESPLPRERVLFLARHLMRNGRTLEAYRDGQALYVIATRDSSAGN